MLDRGYVALRCKFNDFCLRMCHCFVEGCWKIFRIIPKIIIFSSPSQFPSRFYLTYRATNSGTSWKKHDTKAQALRGFEPKLRYGCRIVRPQWRAMTICKLTVEWGKIPAHFYVIAVQNAGNRKKTYYPVFKSCLPQCPFEKY